MSTPTIPNDLIFYHYNASPYARRIVWYLQLRSIAFAECPQPPFLPRPDVRDRLQTHYRRIPLLAHARHLYLDSRHILSHLEAVCPDTTGSPALSPKTADGRALLRLLERYTTDSGLFARAASLIPAELPLLKDPKFQADRKELTGREFSPEAFAKGRPEALAVVRDLFELLETTVLADGRAWLTEGRLTLADIEGAWIIDWLLGMPGALPTALFGEHTYPRVFAWHARFSGAIKDARARQGKPMRVTGEVAARHVLECDVRYEVAHDASDPLTLQVGEEVTVWPLDSGSGAENRDTGRLVALGRREVVLEKDVEGRGLRIHAPRWGFRVMPAKAARL